MYHLDVLLKDCIHHGRFELLMAGQEQVARKETSWPWFASSWEAWNTLDDDSQIIHSTSSLEVVEVSCDKQEDVIVLSLNLFLV